MAATRHVAPDGDGTACSATAPCDLETGVERAVGGDEVVIAGGTHIAAVGVGPGISVPPGLVTVRGETIGSGRP